MKMFALDGELSKFKYDLKFVEKALNDCQELQRQVASLEDKIEAKHNDHAKRVQTVSDKQRACDSAIRGLEKQIELAINESKHVQKLVTDARDAQNSIFSRAIEDFEQRQAGLMQM